jgi:hypothetical protein
MPLRRPPAPLTPLTQPQLRAAVASGQMSLTEVLARTDDTAKNTRIGWLLRALPGDRAAEIAALLTAGGIDVSRRLGDLTERQRRHLLDAAAK